MNQWLSSNRGLGHLALWATGSQQIEAETIRTARAMVQMVDQQLEGARILALTLSTSDSLRAAVWAGLHRLASELVQIEGSGSQRRPERSGRPADRQYGGALRPAASRACQCTATSRGLRDRRSRGCRRRSACFGAAHMLRPALALGAVGASCELSSEACDPAKRQTTWAPVPTRMCTLPTQVSVD